MLLGPGVTGTSVVEEKMAGTVTEPVMEVSTLTVTDSVFSSSEAVSVSDSVSGAVAVTVPVTEPDLPAAEE